MGVCGAGQGSGWPRLLRSPAGLAGDPRSRYLWIEACTLNKAFVPQMYTHPTAAIPDCPSLCATPRCFPAVLVSQAVLWRAEGSCRGGSTPSLVQKRNVLGQNQLLLRAGRRNRQWQSTSSSPEPFCGCSIARRDWCDNFILANCSVWFPLENPLSQGRIPTADECVQHWPGFWSLMDVLSLELQVWLRPEMIFSPCRSWVWDWRWV